MVATALQRLTTPGLVVRWRDYLLTPVDGASLAVFRVCFGLLMVCEVWRYWHYGWIADNYITPSYFFSYLPFVRPWPGNGMYWHCLLLGALGLLIAAGLGYRLAAGLFCLAFSYLFLLDKTQYLNHFYLISLISLLLALVPAHRVWSLDRLLARSRAEDTVPRWSLLVLRAQIALVYFFGGIAKLNSDWLRGQPIGMWLAERSDLPLIGPLLTLDEAALLFAYGGLAIDLSMGLLLIWRRTFWLGALLALLFHLLNAQLFNIGIFPAFMIATLALFLRPDWPRVWWKGPAARPVDTAPAGSSIAPLAVAAGGWRRWSANGLLVLLHLYVLVQLAIPLRHWLYPGDVGWTEEGHRFSWRMKLREKGASIALYAADPHTGMSWDIDLEAWLTQEQIDIMGTHPDMILQFAHHVADQHQAATGVRPIVTADVIAWLNDRPEQLVIDPTVDLAAQPISLRPATWIVPLHE
jgi:hypothetical protein